MKEGFDGAPLGVRITRRDHEIMKRLSTTMYPGLYLSMSDVARVLMREGMKAYGIAYPPDSPDDPENPVKGHAKQPVTSRAKRSSRG